MFFLARNNWNCTIVYKLFVFDGNTWNNVSVCKIFLLDWDTYKSWRKQMIRRKSKQIFKKRNNENTHDYNQTFGSYIDIK